jgi:hypothetical protein
MQNEIAAGERFEVRGAGIEDNLIFAVQAQWL